MQDDTFTVSICPPPSPLQNMMFSTYNQLPLGSVCIHTRYMHADRLQISLHVPTIWPFAYVKDFNDSTNE